MTRLGYLNKKKNEDKIKQTEDSKIHLFKKKKEKEGKKKKMYCFFKMPMDYAELYLWSFILSSQEEAENLRRRCQEHEKA